jgi:hypothetical protein
MAYRADAGTSHRPCPTALDPLYSILRRPLKRRLPYLALAIGGDVGRRSSRNVRSRGRSWLTLFGMVNNLKSIVVGDIRDDGIKCSGLDGFELGPESIGNEGVPTM